MAGTRIHPYHLQWPPATVLSPPLAPEATPPPHHHSIPMENPNRLSNGKVRTIFISSLIEDVKERELQNLLRWLPGYEALQVNFEGEHPIGFALFTTPHFAIAAKDALQEMVFDAESKSVLHTEMAKKNLFVKSGIYMESQMFQKLLQRLPLKCTQSLHIFRKMLTGMQLSSW